MLYEPIFFLNRFFLVYYHTSLFNAKYLSYSILNVDFSAFEAHEYLFVEKTLLVC